MSTYDRIQKLCQDNGTNITVLEKELGFGRGSIGKLKKGGSMSAERLKQIADHFGVTTQYLIGGEESKPDTYYIAQEAAKIMQDVFNNPDLRLLFDAAKGVSPENIQLAAEMLRRFKETNKDE